VRLLKRRQTHSGWVSYDNTTKVSGKVFLSTSNVVKLLAAGALARTPLGSLQRSPRPL